jgi:hypothetical protein
MVTKYNNIFDSTALQKFYPNRDIFGLASLFKMSVFGFKSSLVTRPIKLRFSVPFFEGKTMKQIWYKPVETKKKRYE